MVKKMIKRTSFLLTFFVANLIASSAYSVTVSKTYVDSSDKTLQKNIVKVLGMVNQKDASGNYISLDTKAQLAIPAINELKAALDAKANVDDVVTADSLTELNDTIAALESGKATVADLQALQSTVDKLGDTYATDTELTNAIANVQSAIDDIDLSAYVKSTDLAAVAKSGAYADLTGKPEIPSIEGLATEQALTNLQNTLTAEIAKKQEAGEYLVAGDLTALQNSINTLQSGKADASTVATIQETISKLGETYATDTELADAIAAIDLTAYAKKVDLAAKEDVSNKLATATAEQIKAMSSSDKESKYPSVAVAQTIADAAVTQVNEVAGDLSTLQTQVNTNTADIGELDETVADVRVVAYAAIPAPTEKCKAVSGSCALSSDTNGNLTWVMIANSSTDVK